MHYRVVNHTSQLTIPSVVDTSILTGTWTSGTELWYDSTNGDRRYLGSAAPCEVAFVRYVDRTTDVYLYEDSLFPVVNSVDLSFTTEATSLMYQYANDPDDPIEVLGKVVKVFVLPAVAVRNASGQVIPGPYLGWAGPTPAHAAFPAIYLGSRRIADGGRWSAFAHEVSHLLAPPPDWDDTNDTPFTSILTYVGELKWEWDEALGQVVNRPATEQSVRSIINVSGKSQCQAAWTKSYVRDLTPIAPQ